MIRALVFMGTINFGSSLMIGTSFPKSSKSPIIMSNIKENLNNQIPTSTQSDHTSSKTGIFNPYKSVIDDSFKPPIIIQGGSLRTWSYKSPYVEQVQVKIASEGRPVDADIELWHGPGNTPCKMRVYAENGNSRPFNAVLETPRGPNTIAIRNIGQVEFPALANVNANNVEIPTSECLSSFTTIQGGALKTYPFDPMVDSTQVLLRTDGRPLNARIELLQGPNNNKQVVELYTEDGCDRPFFCILETPGPGNVIRVVNTAPIEFPLLASVTPYSINNDVSTDPKLGGDVSIGGDCYY